jgi:hypothetical protein
VATKLGDLADETVIVGGLVPSLLVDQTKARTSEDRHIGTLDLDGPSAGIPRRPPAGPGAYVILEALDFKNRGENKDAYDLFYLLRHFGNGIGEVVDRLLLCSRIPQP